MKKVVITVVILGAVGLAVLVGLRLVASHAVPELQRAVQQGNEVSAVLALRAIVSAQTVYNQACGPGFYAPSLTNLGVAAAGLSEPFLAPDLATADTITKSGYVVTMGSTTGAAADAPPSCNGLAAGKMVSGYCVTATPASAETGARAFAANTNGTVWFAVQQTPIRITNTGQPAGTTEYK
jgi:hypothetical protein